jgi:hypothetical protein
MSCSSLGSDISAIFPISGNANCLVRGGAVIFTVGLVPVVALAVVFVD